MTFLAFAASNSSTSINQQFAHWAARQMPGGPVDTLHIADYELPIYSPEREAALGQPSLAREFLQRLRDADAIFISFAEHNGSFTAASINP